MCLMHNKKAYGFIVIGNRKFSQNDFNSDSKVNQLFTKSVSTLIHVSVKSFRFHFEELLKNGVVKTDESGNYYSKRMVQDQQLREVRKAVGKLGGNPNLVNQKPNQTVNQDINQKPTPSSSSSSSPSSSEIKEEEKRNTYTSILAKKGDQTRTEEKPVFPKPGAHTENKNNPEPKKEKQKPKESTAVDTSDPNLLTPQRLAELWNQRAAVHPNISPVQKLSAGRKAKAIARLKENSNLVYWADIFTKLTRLPFYCGEEGGTWRADFDWIIRNPDNHVKISEKSIPVPGREKPKRNDAISEAAEAMGIKWRD